MKQDKQLEAFVASLKVERPLKISPMAVMANEIVPGLWLGNEDAARNEQFMRKNNIKAVLNMTPDVPNHFCSKNVEYMRIPVHDELRQTDFRQMKAFYRSFVAFLEKNHKLEKKNTLVHCVAGRQRSCTALFLYLVLSRGMDGKKVLRLMSRKRTECWHYGQSMNFSPCISEILKENGKSMI